MHPRLFDLHYLNTFGLCLSIGLVLCFAVFRHYVRVKSINRDFAIFLEGNGYLAILMGILFSVLGQALFIYIEDPSKGFRLTASMTVITGILGGVASFVVGYLVWGRRRYGPRLIEAFAIAPACITIAQAFGRLGCFFGGCCYGKPTDSWLGLNFPHLGHAVYPTQLFESAFMFLLFALLFYLAVYRSFQHTMVVYMLGYGVFRFLIEFIRGDERGALIGSLTPSQTQSLLLIVGSVGVYYLVEHLVKSYQADTSLSNKLSLQNPIRP